MAADYGRLEYTTISPDAWESFPDHQAKPVSRWEDALADLQAGKIIEMRYTDKRDKLSKRISIARQATARGFKTDMRYTDTVMAIRKVDGVPGASQRSQDGTPTTRRPRRRRNQQGVLVARDSSLDERMQSGLGIEDFQEALD